MEISHKWLIMIIIAIIVIGLCTPIYTQQNNNSSGITAMEGKYIADSIANIWHDDAILSQIGSIDSYESGMGEAIGWVYTYYSPSTEEIVNDGIKYERAHIVVYANNSTVSEYAIRYSVEIGQSIDNWSIDSSQAHEIALNNDEIKAYLGNYKHADIGYTLQIRETYPNQPIWFIGFQDWGFMDNPHSAEIYIDANTGEVLYVHADD